MRGFAEACRQKRIVLPGMSVISASMNVLATKPVSMKPRMARQNFKIAVEVKHRCAHAYRNRSDMAVAQPANRLPPAAVKPVESGCFLMVPRFRLNCSCPRKQAARIAQIRLVSGTGENIHASGVANGDFLAKSLSDTITNG